jgi:Tfp pilus assembly protein FimT
MKQFMRAFTLIELILIIVVFGIIAAIGSDIYAKIYENYLVTRVMNRLQTKTELALEQITNRLQYRIKRSIIGTNVQTTPFTYIPTADPSLNSNFTVLEWIGYDDVGFKGIYDTTTAFYQPVWSGFIDLNHPNTNQNTLITPGSHLTNENAIIQALSNNQASISDAAIIFPNTGADFNVSKYGWNNSGNSDYVFDISVVNDTTLNITDSVLPNEVYERYRLVWSAYALALDPLTCTQDCNLTLYTNYQPWQGDTFKNNGTAHLLLEHVNVFRFKQNGDIVHIKLCVQDQIVDKNISICKEKVVF